MSAQESDGWIVKDNTTEATYDPKYDGTNTPEGHYYGTAFELEGTVYNADGSTESSGGGISDCVSCHHTTTLGNGTANNSPYERYTIWGYNRTGGDDEKSMRGQNVNAISFRVSDGSLIGAGGASLKGLNSISQFAQILQNLTSATSGAVALGEDPNIKKFVKYVILYNGLNPDSVQVPMTND
ncbi:hypothetical protein [Flavobacterium sp. JP2137]|uniref:hypothetical protein n=1 Tax=Flavobacterium sp. JP2137 TaxID=3414510 RepID=UPI003D300DD8